MATAIVVIAETAHDEITPPTLECVEEARDVAQALAVPVHVVLPGHQVAGLAQSLAAHGADQVTVIEHEALAEFSADGFLAAVAPVLQALRSTLTLAPDSAYARSWLPRLSARWRIPLVTGGLRVKLTEEGYPEVYRNSHNGRLHERLIWARGSALMVMLADGVRGVGAPLQNRSVDVRLVRPSLDPSSFRDRTLRSFPPDPHDVDLSDAERIISGGLGAGGPEGIAQLQALANALNASLGGTRVAADRGWIAADRFIGATGKIVAPKLYFALGVSGAGQHVAGITGSDVIVAINTDRTAPMFKIADLGVVGDLHQIVPLLIEKLEAYARTREQGASATKTTRERAREMIA